MKKKGHGAAIVIILLIIVLLAAGGGGFYYYYYYIKPFNEIKEAIEKEDIDTVVNLYGDLRKDDDREYVSEEMLSYFEDAFSEYQREKYEYEDLEDLYKQLSKEILKKNKDLEEMMETAETLKQSREDFATAEEYFENEDYETAISYYRLVWEEDDNYDYAIDRIAECEEEIARIQAELLAAQMAQGVIGQWLAYTDVSDYLADYLGMDGDGLVFNIGLMLTFNDDGTGTIAIYEQSIYDSVEESADFFTGYLYEYMEDEGYSQSEVDIMLLLLGYGSMEDAVIGLVPDVIAEEIGDLEESFQYDIQGTQIITYGLDSEIEGTFEYDDDLQDYYIIVGENGDLGMEFEGVTLPIYFYRF